MTTAIKINANDGVKRNVMAGGETEVDFDYPIYADTHIQIYETNTAGAISLLVKDTDYSVPAGSVNQQAGGTVTLDVGVYPTGATAGHVFTAYQAAPEARTTDFNQAGDYFADTLNQELDLLTQQNQQLRRDLNRALLAPVDTTISSFSLPAPVDDTVLTWDGVAGAVKNGPTVSEISAAAGNATAAAASAAAAATSEGNAATSETNAAASEAAAQAALDSAFFRDTKPIVNGDSPYALLTTDNGLFFSVDTSGGAVTINLDEIADLTLPFNIRIKKETGDGNAVTINCTGTDTFGDGTTSKTIASVGGLDLIAEDSTSPDQWKTAAFGVLVGTMVVDSFSEGAGFTAGTSTTLTLSQDPGSENNGVLTFDGLTIHHDDYSVSGTTLTYTGEATIPLGTLKCEFRYGATTPIGTPADASVTWPKIASAAIASQAEAEAGTEDEKLMTPLQTAQAIAALAPAPPISLYAESTGYPVANAGTGSFTHGLGTMPLLVKGVLVCTTASDGYAIGDEVSVELCNITTTANNQYGIVLWADVTTVDYRFASNSTPIYILDASDGTRAILTNANWELKIRAWA